MPAVITPGRAERVLVSHTDSSRRRTLADMFRSSGYSVCEVRPGAVLARLRQERFDLLAGEADRLLDQLRLEPLRPLLHITETLVSESSLAAIASTLVKRVLQDSAASAAWLTMEDESSMLEVAGATVLEPRQLGEIGVWLERHYGADASPRVVSNAEVAPHAVEGADAIASWLEREPWDQFVVTPMTVKGRRIGAVFAAGMRDTMRTGSVDLRYLSILASQTAIAIENTRLYHRAHTQSLTDALTGLPNARFLRDHLPTMLAQSRRGRRPFSLILMDSDSLKKVNDRFGHQAGDRLVEELASTIKGRGHGVRSSDVVVRYAAGDEFVVLMPDTDALQAKVVAERLREAIEHAPFRAGNEVVHSTVSLGVATYPDNASTPDELLRCADHAMYAAKRLGKNRVVSYGELPLDDEATNAIEVTAASR